MFIKKLNIKFLNDYNLLNKLFYNDIDNEILNILKDNKDNNIIIYKDYNDNNEKVEFYINKNKINLISNINHYDYFIIPATHDKNKFILKLIINSEKSYLDNINIKDFIKYLINNYYNYNKNNNYLTFKINFKVYHITDNMKQFNELEIDTLNNDNCLTINFINSYTDKNKNDIKMIKLYLYDDKKMKFEFYNNDEYITIINNNDIPNLVILKDNTYKINITYPKYKLIFFYILSKVIKYSFLLNKNSKDKTFNSFTKIINNKIKRILNMWVLIND